MSLSGPASGPEVSRRWIRVFLGLASGVLALLAIVVTVVIVLAGSLDLQTGLFAAGSTGAAAALAAFSRHMLGPFD